MNPHFNFFFLIRFTKCLEHSLLIPSKEKKKNPSFYQSSYFCFMLLGTEEYHSVNFGTLEYWIHLQIPMKEAFKYFKVSKMYLLANVNLGKPIKVKFYNFINKRGIKRILIVNFFFTRRGVSFFLKYSLFDYYNDFFFFFC